MNYPTTAVTMYFNIKDFADATEQVRSKSFYMDKGRATLSLQAPMVVFCDDTCYNDIRTLRNECIENGDSLTTYIVKPIVDYDLYSVSFPILQRNREGNGYYVNSRNTSSYYILCMFKTLAVYLAKQKNPYGTPFYAWIDFGGSHVMRSFSDYAPKMLANPNPKVSFCYIHFRSKEELAIDGHFIRVGQCGAGGTAFSVETDYVDRFYAGMMGLFHEMLIYKVGHTDEQVLTFFHARYPQLCSIYYGDYYSILTNYHAVREDYHAVHGLFLMEAWNKHRPDLAKECAQTILRSVDEGVLSLPAEDIEKLKKF